ARPRPHHPAVDRDGAGELAAGRLRAGGARLAADRPRGDPAHRGPDRLEGVGAGPQLDDLAGLNPPQVLLVHADLGLQMLWLLDLADQVPFAQVPADLLL